MKTAQIKFLSLVALVASHQLPAAAETPQNFDSSQGIAAAAAAGFASAGAATSAAYNGSELLRGNAARRENALILKTHAKDQERVLKEIADYEKKMTLEVAVNPNRLGDGGRRLLSETAKEMGEGSRLTVELTTIDQKQAVWNQLKTIESKLTALTDHLLNARGSEIGKVNYTVEQNLLYSHLDHLKHLTGGKTLSEAERLKLLTKIYEDRVLFLDGNGSYGLKRLDEALRELKLLKEGKISDFTRQEFPEIAGVPESTHTLNFKVGSMTEEQIDRALKGRNISSIKGMYPAATKELEKRLQFVGAPRTVPEFFMHAKTARKGLRNGVIGAVAFGALAAEEFYVGQLSETINEQTRKIWAPSAKSRANTQ